MLVISDGNRWLAPNTQDDEDDDGDGGSRDDESGSRAETEINGLHSATLEESLIFLPSIPCFPCFLTDWPWGSSNDTVLDVMDHFRSVFS